MGSDLRHRVIAAGLAGIAASHADRWLGRWARGRGAILMFHHVRPPRAEPFRPNDLLSITPAFLDRTLGLVRELGWKIVALDDVPTRLADPGSGRFVALTFDDGYRDNRDHALPVLKRHGAPWTLFCTTEYLSGGGRLWWLELEEVVRRSERLDWAGRTLPAGTTDEKDAAFAAIYRDLRTGPEDRLRDTIGRWCDAVEVDRGALVRELCLDWDELAALAAAEPSLTIGAHTLSHPMLAKHDGETARREIAGSRVAIEARLGRPVRHLAYPVGDPGSAGTREFQLARDAGFSTAVTTRPGHLFPAHLDHLTALPRVSVNGLHQSEGAIRALLSGIPFLAWNRGRRVNVD